MIVILVVCAIYAFLNFIGGFAQLLQKGKTPILNPSLLMIGSVIILISIFIHDSKSTAGWLLLFGFVFIQTGAVLNGYYLHGKITMSHQLVRFALLIIVMISFVLIG